VVEAVPEHDVARARRLDGAVHDRREQNECLARARAAVQHRMAGGPLQELQRDGLIVRPGRLRGGLLECVPHHRPASSGDTMSLTGSPPTAPESSSSLLSRYSGQRARSIASGAVDVPALHIEPRRQLCAWIVVAAFQFAIDGARHVTENTAGIAQSCILVR